MSACIFDDVEFMPAGSAQKMVSFYKIERNYAEAQEDKTCGVKCKNFKRLSSNREAQHENLGVAKSIELKGNL